MEILSLYLYDQGYFVFPISTMAFHIIIYLKNYGMKILIILSEYISSRCLLDLLNLVFLTDILLFLFERWTQCMYISIHAVVMSFKCTYWVVLELGTHTVLWLGLVLWHILYVCKCENNIKKLENKINFHLCEKLCSKENSLDTLKYMLSLLIM